MSIKYEYNQLITNLTNSNWSEQSYPQACTMPQILFLTKMYLTVIRYPSYANLSLADDVARLYQ